MATNQRLEETISTWLEESAPTRMPGRVLEATFERTRKSQQEARWRAALGRHHMADRKSTRLNSSHIQKSRMPSSA